MENRKNREFKDPDYLLDRVESRMVDKRPITLSLMKCKKTIGLLICKTKDNVFAQYAFEGSNQPVGISEYELSKLYPEKQEGTIPSIEEIEARLGHMNDDKLIQPASKKEKILIHDYDRHRSLY